MDNSIKDALAATIAGFQKGSALQGDTIVVKEVLDKIYTN